MISKIFRFIMSIREAFKKNEKCGFSPHGGGVNPKSTLLKKFWEV